MDNNKNIIPAVLYLREASNLLKYELPDVSACLLQLAANLLKQYKIEDAEVLSAQAVVDNITSEEK